MLLAFLGTVVGVTVGLVFLFGLLGLLTADIEPSPRSEKLNVGFTFSPRQAEYLGLPWQQTYQAATMLSPNLVRLGAYWDSIEPSPGQYSFSSLDWLLDYSSTRNVRVMLTVGMKAPRSPEFYIPRWLDQQLNLPAGSQVADNAEPRARTLAFISQVVMRYRDRDKIAYWQVENEPLDETGPRRWRISADFLAEEVALVRRLDDRQRPIVVNMFVDSHPLVQLPPWRQSAQDRAEAILKLADFLGLDVYPSRGVRVLGHDVYLNWSRSAWQQSVIDLQAVARSDGKDAWIIEAQTEPWEPSHLVYVDPPASRGVVPNTAVSIFSRLRAAGFPTILFWGVEHWYMRRERFQDDQWWKLLTPFFSSPSDTAGGGVPATVPLKAGRTSRRALGR
ncbi:MAG: beta-galactosidase [Chloroflexi bacterium]|nr:beta-galactosidase [Chloroflexota bacterium]